MNCNSGLQEILHLPRKEMFSRNTNSEQLVQEVKKWTLKCTQLESHNSRLELDLKSAKAQFTTLQKVRRSISLVGRSRYVVAISQFKLPQHIFNSAGCLWLSTSYKYYYIQLNSIICPTSLNAGKCVENVTRVRVGDLERSTGEGLKGQGADDTDAPRAGFLSEIIKWLGVDAAQRLSKRERRLPPLSPLAAVHRVPSLHRGGEAAKWR